MTSIKKITPEAVMMHNAFIEWSHGEDHEALFEFDDVTTNIYAADGNGSRSPDTLWKAGYFTRLFRGLAEKPVWMQFGRFMYSRDYTTLPEQEIAMTAFSVVTNGGCPVVIDNAFPDGSIDVPSRKRLENVYNKIRSKERYLGHDWEPGYAALLYSKESQDWLDMSKSGGSYYFGFAGAYKLLLESHIPFQVISDRKLTKEKLKQFKILVLSDCAVMSKETADLIRDFAAQGGSVIAMGITGSINPKWRTNSSMPLADVFGIRKTGALNYSNSYAAVTDGAIFGDIDSYTTVLLRDCYPERFETVGNARVIMLSKLPATEVKAGRIFTYADDVAPGEITEPFAAVNTFRKGKTVYFGGNIARIYGVYGSPELRSVFQGALGYCGEAPVKTSAPPFVELALYKKAADYVIHLMNYAMGQLRLTSHAGGYAAEHTLPVYDINVSVRFADWEEEAPKSIKLEDGTDIPFTVDGGYVRFSIPRLETHLLVIIGF